jgi:hypothetical protein
MTRLQFKHSKTIERWTQSLVSNHRDAADVAWSTVMVCPFVPLDPFKVLSGRPELQVFAVLRAARPYPLGSMQAPLFFPTLHALAVDDGRGRTRSAVTAFSALNIERMTHTIHRTVETPQVPIIEKDAERRKILGNRPPLAFRAQNVHDPQVTRISPLATVISPAVFAVHIAIRPQIARRPRES